MVYAYKASSREVELKNCKVRAREYSDILSQTNEKKIPHLISLEIYEQSKFRILTKNTEWPKETLSYSKLLTDMSYCWAWVLSVLFLIKYQVFPGQYPTGEKDLFLKDMIFLKICCCNSRTAVSLGTKRQASGCHLYRPIPNDRNKLDLRLNDKYYEFWMNLNLSFFSALMLKKSLKTFDNHVIVHLERWFDFRDYNYLGNTEPFALQKLFKFWDLFITVLKLQLTSSPYMSCLY